MNEVEVLGWMSTLDQLTRPPSGVGKTDARSDSAHTIISKRQRKPKGR